jgi:molecular chaperone DnaJ
MGGDYYETLGLRPDASEEDIRRAYRRLAKNSHPDTSGRAESSERFRQVEEAYETLRDSGRRRDYDRTRAASEAPRAARQAWRPAKPAAGWGFARPETAGPASLEVILTREEARRGVSLPLRLQRLSLCPRCSGRGLFGGLLEELLFGRAFCPLCAGAGTVPEALELTLDLPAGVRSGDSFWLSLGEEGWPPRERRLRARVLVEP